MSSINRPFVVTFIGWIGVLYGVAKLIGLFFKLPYAGWESPVHLPPIISGLLWTYEGAWTVLAITAAVALLSGRRWARIYFTIIYLMALGLMITLLAMLCMRSPAESPLFIAVFCPIIGGLILIIGLLYSTHCNQFFRPKSDPIPFNHYVTVWQLFMALAVGLMCYGAFRIWEFWTGRVPVPTVASAVDPNAPRPIRTFTNTNGATMQARLIYFDGAQVIIEREDGTRFNNPIGLYSAADQAYIRKESGR